MIHFFEQINHILDEAEWIGVVVGLLIVVLIISFIILNIITCVCAISARKSLKEIAHHHAETTSDKKK